jgi:maltose O-acetyltransferase
MIKSPIRIDYGTNVHIHPSCFINWDCYIADSPDCTIAIGKDTIIGVSSRILGVTHPVDWRERRGRYGPSLAGDVKIGNDCFIGAGVTVL